MFKLTLCRGLQYLIKNYWNLCAFFIQMKITIFDIFKEISPLKQNIQFQLFYRIDVQSFIEALQTQIAMWL